MENYRNTSRTALMAVPVLLLTMMFVPLLAFPVLLLAILFTVIAYRDDVKINEAAYYEPDEDQKENNAFFNSFVKKASVGQKNAVSARPGTLTPEQEETLKLLAADIKESDKDFDPPIPLTWDTFNPFRWRKK